MKMDAREGERQRETERDRERVYVCVNTSTYLTGG